LIYRKKITFNDLAKNVNKVIAHRKIINDDKDDRIVFFFNDKSLFKKGYITNREVSIVTRNFKPFVKGLTVKITKQMFLDAYKKKRKRKHSQTRCDFYKNRIFPLPKTKYQKFAERIYKLKGSPKNRKRIITGIIFGKGSSTFKKVFTAIGYKECVVSRYIGVMIKEGKIIIDIPD